MDALYRIGNGITKAGCRKLCLKRPEIFSTFFDCRFPYGEISIMEESQAFLTRSLRISFFLYNNAQYEPPLTFFKNIKNVYCRQPGGI